jgi:hypothetical protein
MIMLLYLVGRVLRQRNGCFRRVDAGNTAIVEVCSHFRKNETKRHSNVIARCQLASISPGDSFLLRPPRDREEVCHSRPS